MSTMSGRRGGQGLRSLAALWLVLVLALGASVNHGCGAAQAADATTVSPGSLVDETDVSAVVAEADRLLLIPTKTVTDFYAARSAGGVHDYYSEGRYWWPDPENPDEPYIRRDGESNPANFTDHKRALSDFSDGVTTLTAAYLATKEQKYADQARAYLLAWFVNADTRMNPSLSYAQAIKGRNTGRGIGIIDTLHLINVAKSAKLLAAAGALGGDALAEVQGWFGTYGDWLTSSEYGIDERDNGNNHSAWWGAQVAAYALISGRSDLLAASQQQYRTQLAIQMTPAGSFPDELARTRPYHYTIYNMDGWATLAELGSTKEVNLWAYDAGNGTFQTAVDWFVPYLSDPSSFPHKSELESDLRSQQVDFLLYAAEGYDQPAYRRLWSTLPKPSKSYPAHQLLHDYWSASRIL